MSALREWEMAYLIAVSSAAIDLGGNSDYRITICIRISAGSRAHFKPGTLC